MNSFNYQSAIEKMVEIRTAENYVRDYFWNNKIFSFLHLSIGQEASAVGVSMALNNTDIMLGNHRSHGHYLAKGGNLSKMIYEILGDTRGCCRGYGGSMHMLDREVGFNGSSPILGSIAPIGVGQAFAQKLNNPSSATIVFVGDGASEEGQFLESINLAVNKKCNILFVIEDNKYSVNSNHLDRKSQFFSHREMFSGMGAIYNRVNGQNVRVVYEATSEAIKEVRKGRPSVLHLDVRRYHAHSGPLLETKDQEYRDCDDTILDRVKNDCIKIAKEEVVNNSIMSLSEIERIIKKKEISVNNHIKKITLDINVKNCD